MSTAEWIGIGALCAAHSIILIAMAGLIALRIEDLTKTIKDKDCKISICVGEDRDDCGPTEH